MKEFRPFILNNNSKLRIFNDAIVLIFHSLSFQSFCEKVMQISWSSCGQREARKHTFEFLMEGFWPVDCIPPCLVLKAGKKKIDYYPKLLGITEKLLLRGCCFSEKLQSSWTKKMSTDLALYWGSVFLTDLPSKHSGMGSVPSLQVVTTG